MKNLMMAMLVATAILAAGCSEQEAPSGQQNEAQRQNDAPVGQANDQKPKTVVVNEGMSEEEEEQLNERIADLEDEVDDQSTEDGAQETEDAAMAQEADEGADAEEAARAAAQDYYAAAAGGDYSYTYSNLSAAARGQFTEDEWIGINTTLGSDAGTYSIDTVQMLGDSTAEVGLTITAADGSSSGRTTRFVLENGGWKHELTAEEYELFAGANADSASASASASAGSDATASGDTKRVTIIITSDKPADVSIYDDSFNWAVNEEIVGSKTYERDLPENSGLSVSAITAAYRAQTTIEIYEDGDLVSQDSDPNGNAIVTY
jgi:hypothetical protein